MKQPKSPRTNYHIGEFAEYMGVTPDFLKHYEECDLLDVHHRENGYRYFNFDQCPAFSNTCVCATTTGLRRFSAKSAGLPIKPEMQSTF